MTPTPGQISQCAYMYIHVRRKAGSCSLLSPLPSLHTYTHTRMYSGNRQSQSVSAILSLKHVVTGFACVQHELVSTKGAEGKVKQTYTRYDMIYYDGLMTGGREGRWCSMFKIVLAYTIDADPARYVPQKF